MAVYIFSVIIIDDSNRYYVNGIQERIQTINIVIYLTKYG